MQLFFFLLRVSSPSLWALTRWICPWISCVRVCSCVIHRDSSRGCCTVRRRGWRSLVSCCTPFFSDSIIWSFSNFWYLSTTFLSNTNTATSWRVWSQTAVSTFLFLISVTAISKTAQAQSISYQSNWNFNDLELEHTDLFGGLLGAVVDPPAQARTPAGNVSSNLKLPRHRVAHDSAGDVRRHLCDGAFQLVQHRLHVQASPGSWRWTTYQSGYLNNESVNTIIGFSQSLKEAETKTLSSQAKTCTLTHLPEHFHIKVPTSVLPVMAEETKHRNSLSRPQKYKMTQRKTQQHHIEALFQNPSVTWQHVKQQEVSQKNMANGHRAQLFLHEQFIPDKIERADNTLMFNSLHCNTVE